MGIEARVAATCKDEHVSLEIEGDDIEHLIGKKGQVLDAFQLIVGRIVSRRLASSMPLTIDADGYRQRRAESLQDLAQRLRDKAVEQGEVIAVNPMSARDRRVIHMALREDDAVITRSEGDGDERRLLIIPQANA